MTMAFALILLVVATVLFHVFSPWWFTPIASNWQTMDDTVNLTFWVTGVVFVAVNLFMAYAVYRYRHIKGQQARAHYEPESKKLEWWLTGITTVGEVLELLEKGDEAVMSIRNFGEKSLDELRQKMPFANIAKFEQNPELTAISDLFTVDMITKYIVGKLGAKV